MREWSAAALDAFPVGTRHARAGGQDGAANSASGARHARERVVQGPETNPTLPKGPKVHGTAIPARQGRRSNATWVSILSQRCPLGFASRLRRSLHRLEPNDTASRDQRPQQQRTGRGACAVPASAVGSEFSPSARSTALPIQPTPGCARSGCASQALGQALPSAFLISPAQRHAALETGEGFSTMVLW